MIHSEGKFSFVRYALVELFRSTSNERFKEFTIQDDKRKINTKCAMI